jgi:hypothetical protein
VATSNPMQWDHLDRVSMKRHSLTSHDGPKRGHRRQNCIRITNLPIVDVRPSVQRLPGLREEQHVTNEEEPPADPFEVQQPWPVSKSSPRAMDFRSAQTPSPFKNIPILTPTPRPARKRYINIPSMMDPVLRPPSGTPRPDSEVFDIGQFQAPPPHLSKTTSQLWSISLSPPTQACTPPSARPSERTPFESPMLPSPALKAASLYTRKSLVKGPRSPRNSGQNQVGGSTSPTQTKENHRYRVTKNRDSNAQSEVALGKTVMMLKSMHSEARLFEPFSMPGPDQELVERSAEILAMPSPLLNKRIIGLRESSCSPSIASTALSPTLERQQSRVPSPLASNPVLQLSAISRFNRNSRRGPGPDRLSSHLSMNPSMRIPSMMSTGGASIWEDASVRADSPDPEGQDNRNANEQIEPSVLRTQANAKTEFNFQSQHPSRSSSRASPFQYTLHPFLVRDFGMNTSPTNEYIVEEDENVSTSRLVQQLERVVSDGQWSGKTLLLNNNGRRERVSDSSTQAEPMTPRTKQELDVFGPRSDFTDRAVGSKKESGIGLGLKLDNLVVR